MVYLNSFDFPSDNDEYYYFKNGKTANLTYNTINPYPFRLFSKKKLFHIDFADITIFYGGNGSGKSTALNMIAEHLGISRSSPFNKTPYSDDFARMCKSSTHNLPKESRIITSDDVFDGMLGLRELNQDIDRRRNDIYDEWYAMKSSHVDDERGIKFDSIADYEELRRRNRVKSKKCTSSAYINERLEHNVSSRSNGESAFGYFTRIIDENALYLLDEPENSLSPKLCVELAQYIADAARFYRCQFVMATHSPLMLSMRGARIYDLDSLPVAVKKWTELENVRLMRDFFAEHDEEFS